ncbi:MAG: PhoH family protein [Rhodospirillaceae bacterium]|nr:PhoH family protein [Rhodospirillaceae bacterium]
MHRAGRSGGCRRVSALPTAAGANALSLEFEDNALVRLLCGAHDEHLARIEKAFDVTIVGRGNRLTVAGPEDRREAARVALAQLYDRLKRGRPVERADVDAEIRFAQQHIAQPDHLAPADRGGADRNLVIGTRKRQIVPRTPNQANYIRSLKQNELVIALGPAGTGKSYLAVAMAVTMLQAGQVERIILSRPAVEAGERLGFLPGDVKEKVDPYLRPLYDALYDLLPGDQVTKRLETGEIEVAPLAFMRGRTLANAYIIVDEAQNTTPMQMKMLLTRLGENSRMVVTGDLTQIDLPTGVVSGLRDAVEILEGMEGVAFIHFGHADVVRHELVQRIARAYDERDGRQAELNLVQAPARKRGRA